MLTADQIKSMKPAEIAAAFAAQAAALAAAQAQASAPRKLTMKVSAKGALSLYGLSKQFPMTLYKSQWEKVLDISEQIRAFIAANSAVKPDGVDKDGNVVKTYLVTKGD